MKVLIYLGQDMYSQVMGLRGLYPSTDRVYFSLYYIKKMILHKPYSLPLPPPI